jgi:hypothetical protein
MTLTKRGGIYFIAIGNLRISICKARPKTTPVKLPHVSSFSLEDQIRAEVLASQRLRTYTESEHNRYII